LQPFCSDANSVLYSLGFSRGAIRAAPALAVDSMKSCFRRLGRATSDRESTAMPASTELLVTINRYLVKRSTPSGGFAAAGDSVPGPLPTFSVVGEVGVRGIPTAKIC
jgi:hypothetical protein